MQEAELYRLLGALEEGARNHGKKLEELKNDYSSGLCEIKEMLDASIEKRESSFKNLDERMGRVEVVIGKFTVKLGAAAIVVVAFMDRIISWLWDKITAHGS